MKTFKKLQNVELKLARSSDARRIASMSRELIESGLPWSWTSARVAEKIRCRESNVLTAWVDERLVGFAIMQYFGEHAHLNLLAVDTAYQCIGIGCQLIEWLEKTARVGGIFVVNLEVRAKNMNARTFYLKRGYQEIKSVPGYYCGQEAAVCMAHDLRL